jgi:spermidine/putrescine transport system permease protein
MRSWFLLPARLWMALFSVAPLAVIASYSLLTRGDYGGVERPWTGESFLRLADPLYIAIFWRSLWVSTLATALCGLLGFPLALFIARAGRRRNLYLQLVLLPFWTSFLVRTYAWLFILRDTGLINTLLQSFHATRAPLPLLYNEGSVLLGLVYNYLPFFVLPVFAALERIDASLLDAAADLGAQPRAVLRRVILPLSAPGLTAGAVLVFIPCLGAYLTPDLLGGGKTIMLGSLVQNQFTSARDWPFGSALSLVLMVACTLMLSGLSRSRLAREFM